MTGPAPPVTLDTVRRAAELIAGQAHRTPVVTSRTLDERTGASVLLKAENLQRTGSFKFRGALTAVLSLPPERRSRGVVAYSSGNHAQAVALAARLSGVPAVVVMPTDAPPAKRAATLGYGAEVVDYDRRTGDREAVARDLSERRGLTLVPPYDAPDVMAGQGTVALELRNDAGPLDVLVVCCSGGGLAAGCATAVKGLDPRTRVVVVEPATADDTRQSLAAGRRIRLPQPDTISDGLAVQIPGALTFGVLAALVDDAVVVSDAETVAAMRLLFERAKQVVEPSGAVGVAALLAGRLGDVTGQRVGVTLSGGNVAADRFAALLAAYPD